MPYSYTLLPGNGSNTNFNFSFGYLSRSHIHVKVDLEDVSFTWLTDFSIQIDPAPASGSVVEIRRITPLDQPAVVWTDGSTLTEQDMNYEARFNLYVNQESRDASEASVTQNALGEWDGQGRKTTNFADPTDPTGLVTRSYFESTYTPLLDSKVAEATTQANNAATSAATAQGYAAAADDSADAAAALLGLFRGQYLGAQPSNPTVDGNGQPVTAGDLYFNTTVQEMRVYASTGVWKPAGSTVEGILKRPPGNTPIIATAGQTNVPVAGGYDPGLILVLLNGVAISYPEADTSSGSDIVFATPLVAGDEVDYFAYGSFQVADTYTRAESADLFVQTVSTIAELRNVPQSSMGKALVLGYYAAGDGGGGLYRLDASDTTSADDGGSIIVGADGGRWKLGKADQFVIEQFGAKRDGSDCTAVFNAALAACKRLGVKKLVFSYGHYNFKSRPNAIDFGISLVGCGVNATVLDRDYNESGQNALLDFVAGSNGSSVKNLAVISLAGTSGGCAIRLLSSADSAVSTVLLEDLWVTTKGTDTWNNGIVVDGSARVTPATGVRDTAFRNVHIFGASSYSLVLNHAVGFTYMGGGIYPAGGSTAQSGGIQIRGVDSTRASQYVLLNITGCGVLNMTNCKDVEAHIPVIAGAIENASSASNIAIYGKASGTVAYNWTNGTYVERQDASRTSSGYRYLPNGMIEQWMTISATASTQNFNFPIEFPNACLTVQLTGSNPAYFPYYTNFTRLRVTVGMSTGSSGSTSVQVFATGY
ncbi:tail fiber protein [Bordetella phage vB_BbrP_BB8]|uniref:Tail fiber protein n=1 Tax=Bordetella phage vB_BbrP_BB8 TaxID=2587820 RepID=A0A4Y5TNV2_9CAUD|nr:tail fiber protein [Bordetella phage vB_BbrP_BB8]